MPISKVDYYGETLIDITDSTVTADTLAVGEIAYDGAGNRIVGTMEKPMDIETILDKVYPVGSVYIDMLDYDPLNSSSSVCKIAALMPNATWILQSPKGMALATATSAHRGGSTTLPSDTGPYILTKNELPPHTHAIFDGGPNLIGSTTAVSSLRGSITSNTSSGYNYVRVANSGASMSKGSHDHGGNTGDGSASGLNGKGHSHTPGMPASLRVNVWKRTA